MPKPWNVTLEVSKKTPIVHAVGQESDAAASVYQTSFRIAKDLRWFTWHGQAESNEDAIAKARAEWVTLKNTIDNPAPVYPFSGPCSTIDELDTLFGSSTPGNDEFNLALLSIISRSLKNGAIPVRLFHHIEGLYLHS